MVKHIRTKLRNAIKIIMAAAVLHNIAIAWHDEMPVEDHPGLVHIPDPPLPAHIPGPEVNVVNDLPGAERRRAVAAMRDNYRAMMDPVPSAREVRRMAVHQAEAEARRQARR